MQTRPTGPRLGGIFALAILACGADPTDPSVFAVPASAIETSHAPCADHDPRRMALFGDLHVHTALSSDAWNYDLEVRPSGAYAYAFGRSILLPPKDDQGVGTRSVQIDRPLDFAAVTDHAEFLGEQTLCSDPDSKTYDTDWCRSVRDSTTPIDSPLALMIASPIPSRDEEVCGKDLELCDRAVDAAWQETIAAAESWNDTSSTCARTTFIGYEYSSLRLGSNLHRNVIFRSSVVPKRPISYIEATREWELWKLLRETCNDSGTGCQALAIPHNSNISNGRMFAIDYPGASSVEAEKARAALRIAIEPVVEIMQHKGDSECRRGFASVLGTDDVLCDFEKFAESVFRNRDGGEAPGDCYDGPFADSIPHLGPNCMSPRSYVRYALIEGLGEEKRLGVNPFKFGIIASTDTHNAMAGGVEERTWPGHLGIADAGIERRLAVQPEGSMGNVSNGPGGLIGVWAEENSRAAIFDAIRRKEVFGTSGPRIEPRFYAGFDLPDDLCGATDVLAVAEERGVPMGGDLSSNETSRSPVFAVWASRDPGTAEVPGGLLQRIQLIKGWLDEDGKMHQRVIDIAGGDNDADVDPLTCEPSGDGHDFLCGVWKDPEFDAERRAVYYARVIENPSCRYSAWQCLGLPGDDKPSGCSDPDVRRSQHERAWTSPIWYTPKGASPLAEHVAAAEEFSP